MGEDYPHWANQFIDPNGLERHPPAEDCGEWDIHPILSPSTRMTERRILDMVAYLLCRETAPRIYRERLRSSNIPSRQFFNYALDRYQEDFDRDALWKEYFLKQPSVAQICRHRRIDTLDELEQHAEDYFGIYSPA